MPDSKDKRPGLPISRADLLSACALLVISGCFYLLASPANALAWCALTAFGALAIIAGGLRAHTRIAALRARLSQSVRIDELTGLLNRRAFEQELDLELERSRRSARALSLMVADVDGFRDINEGRGHHAGDAVLAKLGKMLADSARRVDVAARVDGEAFALLLPGTDEAGAYMFAERLRAAVEDTFAAEQTPLTISFGISSYPAHGYELGALMRSADHALYTAKALGRNRTVICNQAIAAAISTDAEQPQLSGRTREAA